VTRILILSTTTGYQLRSFGEAAARLGIELVFATDRCHRLDDPWRDAAVPVRFHEEAASLDAIVKAAKLTPIDGVIAVGDRPVVLAARAAMALGIPGNPPAAAAATANKKLARQLFAEAGMNVPWFFEVHAGEESAALASRASYPLVVKPLGLSGSRGVIRADSLDQLVAAIARVRALLARPDVRAIRSGLDETVLVEGFIEGSEVALEGVLTRGALRTCAIFDKPERLDGPFFEETIYVAPSGLAAGVQQAVRDEVQRGVAALGLTDGPVHAECRVGPAGVSVLEIAARPIGGLCSRGLRFTRSDSQDAEAPRRPDPMPDSILVSLEEILLRHAAGQDISGFVREPEATGVMMIPIPQRGMLKRVEGLEGARDIDGVDDVRITAKIGHTLERLPEAGSYLGFIFARGATPAEVIATLKQAHRQLTFTIDAPITLVKA